MDGEERRSKEVGGRRAGKPAAGRVGPARSYPELWNALSPMEWRSLVLVPVDEDGSTAGIATALADLARRQQPDPVTFTLLTGPVDYVSAARLVGSVARPGPEGEDAPQPARVIFAIPPVVAGSPALAVATAADAVVVYARKGRTSLNRLERTIDLVGRDRVVGCIVG